MNEEKKNINTLLLPICIVLWMLIEGFVFSQNVEFKPSNFSGDKEAFKAAKQSLKYGEYFFIIKEYQLAKNHFQKAWDFNPNNADLNYKLGICFLETYPKHKSLQLFKKAYELDSKIAPDILYQLARGYHLNFQFDKAIELYNKSRNLSSTSKESNWSDVINKRIEECNNGKIFIMRPRAIEITNLGESLNSRFPEYRPFVAANDSMMIFTARRDNTTGKMVDPRDQEYYEDIYVSYKVNGAWQEPKSIGASMNSMSHDAVVGLSGDGNNLVYFDGSKNGGDLYLCTRKNNNWSTPKLLPKTINTEFHESSASFSKTGDTLYFVSDRPDKGQGGKDIYMSSKNKEGEWSEAKNLGNTINTRFDEDGVIIHPDGQTMYYSSKGHNSMGGYDIFVSVFYNGQWTEPMNMGYPVNTPDDDVFFVISEDGSHGYYSSAKEDGYGDQDIYEMRFSGTTFSRLNKEVATIEDSLLADVILDIDTFIIYMDSIHLSTTYQLADLEIKNKDNTLDLDDDLRIDDDLLDDDGVPNEPIEVEIEIINVSIDKGMVAYLPTSTSGKFDFMIPGGSEYEVDVDLEDLATSYGSKELLSSILNDSTILSDNTSSPKNVSVYDNIKDIHDIKDTETRNQTMELNKKYTIQLKAMRFPLAIDYHFKGLAGVRELYCSDSLYRYIIREFDNKEEALAEREKMISLGYMDAFVASIDDLKSKTVNKEEFIPVDAEFGYTVQIFASNVRVSKTRFRYLDDVKEYQTEKGIYIYATGRFPELELAKQRLRYALKKGYKDAFIISIRKVK